MFAKQSVALALVLSFTLLSIAKGNNLLDRLPASTRILLRVEDGARWANEFDSTAIHGVIYSATFKPLREYLGVASDSRRALQQAGLRAKDIRELSRGEVILARIDPPHTKSNLLIGPNDQRATLTAFEVDPKIAQQVIADLRKELLAAGAVEAPLTTTPSATPATSPKTSTSPETSTSHETSPSRREGRSLSDGEGAAQTIAPSPKASNLPVRFTWPGKSESWIYSYTNGHFIVSDRSWLIEKLTTANTKPQSSQTLLQTKASFAQIMKQTQTAATTTKEGGIEVQWYATPWELTSPTETTNMLFSQGFRDITAVGGRLFLAKNQTTHYSFVATKQPLQKAASGLSFVSRSVPTLPAWLTQKTKGCLATQLNFNQALKGYGHWFDQKHGGGDEGLFDVVLDDIRDEPGAPGVDIRTDLVAQFDGPLLSLVVKNTQSKQPNDLARLFAIKVRNSQAVAKTIDALLNGDPDVTSFKIGDFPSWRFGDLSRGGTRQVLGPDLSSLTVCVANDYIVAAPNERALRQLVDPSPFNAGEVAASVDNPLQKVAAALGVKEPIGLGYSESLGPIGNLYERVAGLTARDEAKSMTIPELLRIFHLDVNEAKVHELRSKLPRGNELAELFGQSLDAAESAEGGWLLKGIVKRKAE